MTLNDYLSMMKDYDSGEEHDDEEECPSSGSDSDD